MVEAVEGVSEGALEGELMEGMPALREAKFGVVDPFVIVDVVVVFCVVVIPVVIPVVVIVAAASSFKEETLSPSVILMVNCTRNEDPEGRPLFLHFPFLSSPWPRRCSSLFVVVVVVVVLCCRCSFVFDFLFLPLSAAGGPRSVSIIASFPAKE